MEVTKVFITLVSSWTKYFLTGTFSFANFNQENLITFEVSLKVLKW